MTLIGQNYNSLKPIYHIPKYNIIQTQNNSII